MALVEFKVSDSQLRDLQRILNPKQVRTAIYAAVRRTTNKARQIAAKAVLERMEIPRKYVDNSRNRYAAIRSRIVANDPPVGILNVKRVSLPLSAFKAKASKSGGVTVTVDKQQPPIVIRHGFMREVQTKRQMDLGVSHKGIFTRKRTSARLGEKYTYRWKKYTIGVTPKGIAWRLPINQHFGPSVLAFITRDEIRIAVEKKIGNEFEKQIDSQVSRFTEGRFNTLAAAAAYLDGDAGDPNANA